MSLGKEQIWIRYKLATRMQYVITLLTLHSLGFGHKRLAEFENKFYELLPVVNEYAKDGMLIDKLTDEFCSMGYDIKELMSDRVDLTFSQMQRAQQAEKKMQLSERIEIAKKLKASGFYGGKEY